MTEYIFGGWIISIISTNNKLFSICFLQSKIYDSSFLCLNSYSMWSGEGQEVCTIFIVPCSLCPISKQKSMFLGRSQSLFNQQSNLQMEWVCIPHTSCMAYLDAEIRCHPESKACTRLGYLRNGTRHIWACRTRFRLIVLLSAKWHSYGRALFIGL